MAELVLHPLTEAALRQFTDRPTHAVLIIGPVGAGKTAAARLISSRLLGKPLCELDKYPHLHLVAPIDHKAISIESVRELQSHMTLKVPQSGHPASRMAIIEDAHLLTTEAQNALLKTLEEPPEATVIILTATGSEALLPTILSRVRTISLTTPTAEQLSSYFAAQGHLPTAVQRALMVSGGLPGLTHALLTAPEEHVLFAATEEARRILQSSTYERLAMVDSLSKQKALTKDVLFILGQMAKTALARSAHASAAATARWQRVLSASFAAENALGSNAQAKLVLTNLMLEL